MRLSNNIMYQNNLDKILDNQQKVAIAQEKVSTQTRILSPSDDPAASAQALLFSERIDINDQFQKNNSYLTSKLQTEESVLQNIKTSLQRGYQLTVQAGNGALSEQDRETIAEEMKSIQATLYDLMNSKSEDGKFIFSGFQDSKQTYIFNSATGTYDYQGDQGNHEMQLAVGVTLRSSDNGADAFENVDARLNVDTNTPAVGGGITSSSVYVKEQAQFDAFHKANYDPLVPANNNLQVTVSAGVPDTYSITLGGTPVAAGNFTGEVIKFQGMEISVSGAAPGTSDFALAPPEKKNMLNTLEELITGLSIPGLSNDAYQEFLADGITGLTNSQNQVSITQANLGGRINVAERLASSTSDININHKESKAKLVELDMAAAISDLTKEETALQASQATFGRLTQLSLFDYIR
ncbi:Flagellar hook-associated protein 3 [Pseudoalteromonas sp. P1-9]|uniref:flagellar hook-associated protein FlgL n=1 Tax=Pseudoalteromonas sp. P1-9 TaxID=1710354 RepID=UPI0006D63D2A|nr:flagellar hook-associated protein FlgL [Pseudoalteromonas sp. P1-9]KPV97338.1 Flagellar hook-associated protein 3 [Pseudoalteromonas sp. P1-9]